MMSVLYLKCVAGQVCVCVWVCESMRINEIPKERLGGG